MAKQESDKARKARLEAERKAARPVRKKRASKKVVSAIEEATAKGGAAARATVKKAEPKPAPVRNIPSVTDVVPETAPAPRGGDRGTGGVKNPQFDEVMKERRLAEIGQEVGPEELAAREKAVSEIPFSNTTKNEYVEPNRTETPKQTPLDLPTPSQEARRKGTPTTKKDIPSGGVGELVQKRQEAKLPGLPGDESGVNATAVALAKRDHALAKESGKTVNSISPDDPEPTIESVYYGHHRRMAHLMSEGVTEDQVNNFGVGSGRTHEQKVDYLFNVLKKHKASQAKVPVDTKAQGVTHYIDPTDPTRTPKPLPAEHPNFMVNAGPTERVSRTESGEWALDKNTGNRQVDSAKNWNPDKPEGWNVVNLRGGIKAVEANVAPAGGRSLWDHHLAEMSGKFKPAIDSGKGDRGVGVVSTFVVASADSDAATRSKETLQTTERKGRGKKVQTFREQTGRAARVTPVTSEGVAEVPKVETPVENVVATRARKQVARTKSVVTPEGRQVTRPPERGALVQSRQLAAIPVGPAAARARGITDNLISSGATSPAPKEPTILETTPGVSTASPITTPKRYTKQKFTMVPGKTLKTMSKVKFKTTSNVLPGTTSASGDRSNLPVVDQMIPGLEKAGAAPDRKPVATRSLEIAEGPITSAKSYAEKLHPASSPITRQFAGRVLLVGPKEQAPAAPKVNKEVATVTGNAPQESVPSPVDTARGAKSRSVKPAVEQMELPGLESVASSHAEGQQWLRPRDLSSKTLELQGKAKNAGTPGSGR